MAEDRMAVLETVRKAMTEGDVDFLREGVRVLAQAVMESEVTESPRLHAAGLSAYHRRAGGRRPDPIDSNRPLCAVSTAAAGVVFGRCAMRPTEQDADPACSRSRCVAVRGSRCPVEPVLRPLDQIRDEP